MPTYTNEHCYREGFPNSLFSCTALALTTTSKIIKTMQNKCCHKYIENKHQEHQLVVGSWRTAGCDFTEETLGHKNFGLSSSHIDVTEHPLQWQYWENIYADVHKWALLQGRVSKQLLFMHRAGPNEYQQDHKYNAKQMLPHIYREQAPGASTRSRILTNCRLCFLGRITWT